MTATTKDDDALKAIDSFLEGKTAGMDDSLKSKAADFLNIDEAFIPDVNVTFDPKTGWSSSFKYEIK
jgi:hypothetical protein